MSFDASTLWWALFGAFVIAELLSGTFYLLMLGLACAGGALSAHLGASVVFQVSASALLAVALALGPLPKALQARLSRSAKHLKSSDSGFKVRVDSIDPDGTPVVTHRGAPWRVHLTAPATVAVGDFLVIERVDGVRLVCSIPTPSI